MSIARLVSGIVAVGSVLLGAHAGAVALEQANAAPMVHAAAPRGERTQG